MPGQFTSVARLPRSLFVLLAALLLGAAALAGCGVGNHTPEPTTGVTEGSPVGACLPDKPSALRGSSFVTSGLFCYGIDFAKDLPSQGTIVYPDEDIVRLFPWQDPETEHWHPGYVIYAFDTSGAQHDNIVIIDGRFINYKTWIGLADFTRDTWCWSVCPESCELPIDSARNENDGLVYVVVVFQNFSSKYGCIINTVKLTTDERFFIADVSPLIGTIGQLVEFNADIQQGTPDTIAWDFGNGALPKTATEPQPHVEFREPGLYTGNVRAENKAGAEVFEFQYAVRPVGQYRPWHLYAVPGAMETTVGEDVLVSIISGEFPTNAPFAFMDGVGVTIEEGAEYVEGSINLGAVGGSRDEIDGIWTGLDPQPALLILPQDWMITPQQTSIPGLVRYDFTITPIGGGELNTEGTLFNFRFRFLSPGEYHIGFQEFYEVARTFYSELSSEHCYWYDISNQGVPNTITVLP